jgi:hypothetical protein
VSKAPYAALALFLAPCVSLAQQRLGPAELARAKSLLDLHEAELTAEEYALLSGRLAQTQQAYAELTVATGEAVATAEAAVTGGGAILGGVAEVLPLLLFVWPSTAHAPGVQDERPQVKAARGKLEKSVKELAQAEQQVEAEVAKRPKPPAKATGSGRDQGVKCRLAGERGGFMPARPGRCEYDCTDGRTLCKLIRKGRCPGAPPPEYFPISELDNIEDCP